VEQHHLALLDRLHDVFGPLLGRGVGIRGREDLHVGLAGRQRHGGHDDERVGVRGEVFPGGGLGGDLEARLVELLAGDCLREVVAPREGNRSVIEVRPTHTRSLLCNETLGCTRPLASSRTPVGVSPNLVWNRRSVSWVPGPNSCCWTSAAGTGSPILVRSAWRPRTSAPRALRARRRLG